MFELDFCNRDTVKKLLICQIVSMWLFYISAGVCAIYAFRQLSQSGNKAIDYVDEIAEVFKELETCIKAIGICKPRYIF